MQTHQFNPSVLQQTVVVFSKTYLPVARINIKRAIALLVTGRAESIDFGNGHYWQVHSPSLVLQVSEYIRLTGGDPKRMWRMPPVNRREVLKRDRYACQYCGSTKRLTLDHVIPRSKGGTHTWNNVVTACETCNTQKGNRLLPATGMTLRTKPKAPVHPTVAFAEQFWKEQRMESEA